MPKAAKQIYVWWQSLTPKPIAFPCILLHIMYAEPASASHFPILKCTKTPRMWIALLFTCMSSVSFHSFLGVHPVPPSSCSESTGSASWRSACTIHSTKGFTGKCLPFPDASVHDVLGCFLSFWQSYHYKLHSQMEQNSREIENALLGEPQTK